jgi:hypothetical protein
LKFLQTTRTTCQGGSHQAPHALLYVPMPHHVTQPVDGPSNCTSTAMAVPDSAGQPASKQTQCHQSR